MTRRPAAALGLPAAVTTAVAATACAGNQNVFNTAGPAAHDIARLGWFLIGVCLVIYVLVLIALAWALMRRRRVSDDQPATERTITSVVTAALGVTVVILISFGITSLIAGGSLTSPSGAGAVTIDAVGHQWWWEFTYHDVTPSERVTSPNELHIPVGVPVVLKAQSRDVIHSFWVPNLHGKRDLIPGQVTLFWLQADREGVYRGQCAEFCGHQHAKMAFTVVAEPMDRFKKWIAQQRQDAAEPAAEIKRGHDVFMQSACMMCHAIRGTSAGSRVGPDLTHIGSRLTLAAGTLPNTAPHLTRWIDDPQSIKPGVRMPATPLTPDDRRALVSYLRSLR